MGEPAGVILEISDVKIYHAGDTCLFSDMKLIKELYNPDVVMLPVGGTFTMDIEHATIAAEWLNPRVVIPMHYNTFSAIYTDIERFGMMLQTKGINYQLMQICVWTQLNLLFFKYSAKSFEFETYFFNFTNSEYCFERFVISCFTKPITLS